MSNVVMFEDPISLRTVAATVDYSGGGGWRVSVSGYNFLYTKLKENPKIFIGMVFRLKNGSTEEHYVRITNALPRWVKATKKTDLPILEYLAVKYEMIGQDLIRAIELIEEHREKTEGPAPDESSANESN